MPPRRPEDGCGPEEEPWRLTRLSHLDTSWDLKTLLVLNYSINLRTGCCSQKTSRAGSEITGNESDWTALLLTLKEVEDLMACLKWRRSGLGLVTAFNPLLLQNLQNDG